MDAFIIEEINIFSKFIQLKKEVPTKSILLLLSKDNRAKTSQNISKRFYKYKQPRVLILNTTIFLNLDIYTILNAFT